MNPDTPKVPPSDATALSQPEFNFDDAVKHCLGKYEVFQEMVNYFFNEMEPSLAQIRRALARTNAEELGRIAHRFKGTVGHVGAPAVVETLQRLERMGITGNLAGAADAIERLATQVERLKTALAPHRGNAVR